MGTRDELVEAVGARYRNASREEKGPFVEEFVAVSGYCRKHAARLLRRVEKPVVLWESSDRICGKRSKALIPMLFVSTVSLHEIEHGALLKESSDPAQGAILRAWFDDHVAGICRSRA